MKLSNKSLNDLYLTVKAFFDEEEGDGTEIANQTLCDIKEGIYTFELWDSLGCDDLGLVRSNKELQKFYKKISSEWQQSIDAVKN